MLFWRSQQTVDRSCDRHCHIIHSTIMLIVEINLVVCVMVNNKHQSYTITYWVLIHSVKVSWPLYEFIQEGRIQCSTVCFHVFCERGDHSNIWWFSQCLPRLVALIFADGWCFCWIFWNCLRLRAPNLGTLPPPPVITEKSRYWCFHLQY